MTRFLSGLGRTWVVGIVVLAALPAFAQSEEAKGPRFSLRGHLAPLLFMGNSAEVSVGASGSETRFDPGIGADVGFEVRVGEEIGLEANLGLYWLESTTKTHLSWWGEGYSSQATHLFVPLDLGANFYIWETDRSVGYWGPFGTMQFGSGRNDDASVNGHFSRGFLLGMEHTIGDRGRRLSFQLRFRRLVVEDPGFDESSSIWGVSFGIGVARLFCVP